MGHIEEYKNNLSDYEMLKIEKVINMPVEELQKILFSSYKRTNNKTLKILADVNSGPFIEKNLNELEKVLFKEIGN